MLQPEELKINNLVSVNEIYRNEGDLLELNQNNFEALIINDTYRRIFPIPLNEEWLFKMGFDNVRKNILMCHNEYHNNRINEGAFYVEPVGDAFNHWYLYHKVKMITSNIRHVHQLQNLFYALNGEELTLNK